jgi:bleomycin hydrolase
MKKVLTFAAALLWGLTLAIGAEIGVDSVKYVPRVNYPLFKEIEKRADSIKKVEDSLTSAIRERQKEAKKLRDSLDTELRFGVSHIERPHSPDEFKSVFHFPPAPQDWSSTCWAFSGTSFIESEIFRLSGEKIRLSEMYTVYYEYIEKARRYVRERGESAIGPGSEQDALPRIMKLYGAVPREVYDGLNKEYPHFNHEELDKGIGDYLKYIKDHNFWDEEAVIASIRALLDKYIGRPPDTFEFAGRRYTPLKFVDEALRINLDNYVSVMSTLKIPFYTKGLFDVHDNWRRDSSYYNLPLSEWYNAILQAIQKGYSIAIGGGTSEPGYYGVENIAVIPDFDIPQDRINQDSREYRIYRGTTGDDHGLHLVGYLRKGDRDWFLVKDSGSGSRRGDLKGYFFFRDDYIRLKMLTFMVHKDAIREIIEKIDSAR